MDRHFISRRENMKLVKTAVAAALLGTVFCVSAAEVHVAVAANFTAPAKELAPILKSRPDTSWF